MSKTSATPETTSAGDLLDRWMAHHEREQPVEEAPADQVEVSADQAEDPTPAGTVDPGPAVEEAAAPPAVAAPSGIDAGRAVLEAFRNERLEAAAAPDAPAGADADAGTAHPRSAAGVPSSEKRERVTSTPPRDGRPAPRSTRASAVGSPSVPPTAAPAPARNPTPIRRPPVAPAPGVVLQSPSRGVRRALTVLSLLAAAATAGAGWTAWSERTTLSIGLTAGLAVLALLLWSVRGRRGDTVVSVENDVLRIVHGQSRHEFPLNGTHPPIDILGEPDGRGWKVLIQRRSMSPYVVTRSMVDPQAFTELIRYYRPNA